MGLLELLLDISNAFVRVWHACCLSKCNYYGISGPIFSLFSSFFSNWALWVVLDGKSLKKSPVDAKCPHFGAVLFLLYINDLHVICNIAIYANDTTLYSKCDHASNLWPHQELASKLESDLRDIVDCGR